MDYRKFIEINMDYGSFIEVIMENLFKNGDHKFGRPFWRNVRGYLITRIASFPLKPTVTMSCSHSKIFKGRYNGTVLITKKFQVANTKKCKFFEEYSEFQN